MKKKAHTKSYRRIIMDHLHATLSFLARKKLPKKDFRCLQTAPPDSRREVALLIQFIGDVEGEFILVTAKKTAGKVVKELTHETIHKGPTIDQVTRIKNTLGELHNIIASGLLAHFPGAKGIARVTTPSCIFGTNLTITAGVTKPNLIIASTPFGILEFSLLLGWKK